MAQKKKAASVVDQSLPFEKVLVELQEAINEADTEEVRADLERRLVAEREALYRRITPWQRVQLARHPQRPRMLEYTARVLEDFVELHGDRALGDDPAMVCGLGRFRGETVAVVGQQKGVTTDEKVRRNFGMAHPAGYRKALRIFKLAERYRMPVLTFVDTPAAHPGIEAEQTGQGLAIAQNLLESSKLRTPIFSVVLSEGGSGGALAIAMADWVAMFEYAVYMICPPERCAEILWRDVEQKELAAAALKVSATDLKELGVVDSILAEPGGGAHRNPEGAAMALSEEIARFLAGCRNGDWTPERRQAKFQRMGAWAELEALAAPEVADAGVGSG
ncbi:MAG: acetyl-CoA carboxylase carboxyltransferase subunit alpha [Candidatus Hydrogenedentes bacterium]|nr:acetyl-CoA carboxylase carboxyltransferase subunit alpha [Candidatus Hydrogenedentota bacterium]